MNCNKCLHTFLAFTEFAAGTNGSGTQASPRSAVDSGGNGTIDNTRDRANGQSTADQNNKGGNHQIPGSFDAGSPQDTQGQESKMPNNSGGHPGNNTGGRANNSTDHQKDSPAASSPGSTVFGANASKNFGGTLTNSVYPAVSNASSGRSGGAMATESVNKDYYSTPFAAGGGKVSSSGGRNGNSG